MNCMHIHYRFSCLCLLISLIITLYSPLTLRAGVPTETCGTPSAHQLVGGSVRIVLEFDLNGDKWMTTGATIPNGKGLLIDTSVATLRDMEDSCYRPKDTDPQNNQNSPYERVAFPLKEPSKRFDCGGLTLWTLCRENKIKTAPELPEINLAAAEFAKLVAKYEVPADQLGTPQPHDIIYWSATRLKHSQSHVSYVESILNNRIATIITKDASESAFRRMGMKRAEADHDPLFDRYRNYWRHRLKPGIELEWQYWRPNWTDAGKDNWCNGIDLTGEWIQDNAPDNIYQITLARDYKHTPPLVITEKRTGKVCYGAFDTGARLLRTEWNASDAAAMKYIADFNDIRITWTHCVDRDPRTGAPRPFRPVTWYRLGRGTVGYRGTWMYNYLTGPQTGEVRRASSGKVYHVGLGEFIPFTVHKNVANIKIDMSTGQLSGEMAFSYEYGSPKLEGPNFKRNIVVDLSKLRVDPVAFHEQRGLNYLTTMEKRGDGWMPTGLVFSRGEKVSVPGWPSLGEDFATYNGNFSREQLRSGKIPYHPEFFCLLSRTGVRSPAPTGGTTGVIAAGGQGTQQQVERLIRSGKPAARIVSIEGTVGKQGGDATAVDGATGLKRPMSVNQLLPANSKIDTGADTVRLAVNLPGDSPGSSPTMYLKLNPGTKFNIGEFSATLEALELFLRGGEVGVEEITRFAAKVITPSATIQAIGTRYIVNFDESCGETTVKVIEGQVRGEGGRP